MIFIVKMIMQLCYKSCFPDYYRHTIHKRLKVRCCFTTKDVAIDALHNDNTIRVLCALHCLFSPIYSIDIVMIVYELIQYTPIKSQLFFVKSNKDTVHEIKLHHRFESYQVYQYEDIKTSF